MGENNHIENLYILSSNNLKAREIYRQMVRIGTIPPQPYSGSAEPFTYIQIGSFSIMSLYEEKEVTICAASIRDFRTSPEKLEKFLRLKAGSEVVIEILEPPVSLSSEDEATLNFLTLMKDFPREGINVGGRTRTTRGEIDKIRAYRAAGLEFKRIAALMQCSDSTVRKYAYDVKPAAEPVPRPDYNPRKEFDASLVDQLEPVAGTVARKKILQFITSRRTLSTQNAYFKDLKAFLEHYKEATGRPLMNIKKPDMDYAMSYNSRLGETVEARAHRRSLATLRSFFNFHSVDSPFHKILLPEIDDSIVQTRGFTVDELKALLSYAREKYLAEKDPELKERRHRDFIGVFLQASTGVRQDGILSLRLGDCLKVRKDSFEIWAIEVRLKGRKERHKVDLDKRAKAELQDYLETYYQAALKGDYIIFSTGDDKSRPQSKGAHYKTVRQLCSKSISESKGLTTHSFRVTFTTQCFMAGIDEKIIQKTLGHKKLSTTRAYFKDSVKIENNWMPEL